MTAGYLFDLSNGKFSEIEDLENILTLTDNSQPTADWQGIRVGLSLSYNFLKKPQKNREPKRLKF